MEEAMSTDKLPQIDSIRELAAFWDTHDLTDFDDELEEVTEPVFERETVVQVYLPCKEADAVRNLAKSLGVESADLIRQWVLERVQTTA
jgi:hypothetical protein